MHWRRSALSLPLISLSLPLSLYALVSISASKRLPRILCPYLNVFLSISISFPHSSPLRWISEDLGIFFHSFPPFKDLLPFHTCLAFNTIVGCILAPLKECVCPSVRPSVRLCIRFLTRDEILWNKICVSSSDKKAYRILRNKRPPPNKRPPLFFKLQELKEKCKVFWEIDAK